MRARSRVVLRRSVLVAGAMALGVAGCGGGGEDVDVDGAGEGSPTGGDASAGGTLVAAISAQPDQLDPHQTTAYPSFQVLENIYDTLVVPDAEGNFEPSLATEWTTSDDGLTWTFTLREGVTFHDGSSFEAADVVYSYNRIIDNELANAYRFASVESVGSPDESTVVIELSEPTPALLANIGGFKGMSIIPEGSAQALNLATEAVGTGPFELTASGASNITLTAYDGYWGDPPTVDGVEFRFVSEPATALTALRSGEVHWTDNVPPQQIDSLEEDAELEVATSPSVDYWYMALNHTTAPWSNRDARRGVAFALDREAITEAARFGAATPNQTAMPPDSFWYYDYAPYEHDPEQARELLDAAGVAEGQTLGLMVTNEFPETVQAAQVVQANLADVGIEVQIQDEAFATWLDRQGQGNFDSFLLGWLGNLDPFGAYHAQHICDGASNFHGYCNEEVDELLQQAATETDRDSRKELYDQAAEIIVDDASYIYLYNPDVVQAWVPGLEGYEIRPDKAINFEHVRLPE